MIEECNLSTKNPTIPPDYSQCAIEIIIAAILAIYSSLQCGFMLAIFMANVGVENMYVKSY